MNALLPLLLTLPVLQDDQERVPVEVRSAPRQPSVASMEGHSLRIYPAARLTGHDRLEVMRRDIRSATEPTELVDAHRTLESLEQERDQVDATSASLVETIKERIEPSLDGDTQAVRHIGGGDLALIGTAAQHAWLEGFLATSAQFDGLIDVDAKILELEPGSLATLTNSRSGQILSDVETSALLRQLESTSANTLSAPRVVVRPFQEAQLSVVEQVAYIRDYAVTILPDNEAEIADPVIDVAQPGIQMKLRGVPLAGRRFGLSADFVHATLERPIRSIETSIGAVDEKVTIQLPEITKVHLEGEFDIKDGETLLMAAKDAKDEREILVLVRVKRTERE